MRNMINAVLSRYSNNYEKWLFIFYPLVILYMLLTFCGINALLLSLFVRILFLWLFFKAVKHSKITNISYFLGIFIVYNLFSIILFLTTDIPFDAYTYDLTNFLLPMLAFFLGSNKKDDSSALYDGLLVSMIVCCFIGLYMYFFLTEWYSLKLIEIHNSISYYDSVGTEGDTTAYLQFTRFSSFMLTPYAIQYLGVPSLCIFIMHLINPKNAIIQVNSIKIILLLVLVFCLILCQQRATWFYLIILIPITLSVSTFKFNIRFVWSVLLVITLVALFGKDIFSGDEFSTISEQISSRGDSFSVSDAMGGRENQYQNILNNWDRPLFGYGMGSAGANARIYGFTGTSDAGYMKLLYENGLVGFVIFSLIIIPTFFKAIKHLKFNYVEFNILFFFLLAMLGSNSLSMSFYYSIPFWFAVGRLWKY